MQISRPLSLSLKMSGIDTMSRNEQWMTCLTTALAVLSSSGCGSTLVDSRSPAPNSRNTVIQDSAGFRRQEMTAGEENAKIDLRSISQVPVFSVVTLPRRQNEAFYHEVTREETLTGIARRYGVPIQKLIEANGLETTSSLKPKQLLYIPGPQ
jgi:LysM repeat protein